MHGPREKRNKLNYLNKRTNILIFAGLLLLINGICLFAGLTEDCVTVGTTVRKDFTIFSIKLLDSRESFSIISSVGKLWSSDSLILAMVILLFSILFPIAKLAASILIWARMFIFRDAPWMHKLAHRLHNLGRWSMLDVFVVGMICVWGKMGGVSRLLLEPGMYWFIAAVLLSMTNALLVEHIVKQLSSNKLINQSNLRNQSDGAPAMLQNK